MVNESGVIIIVNLTELRVEILRKNISEKKLAKEIGISRQSLSYKLNNKRHLTLDNIEQIVKVLKLSPARRDEIFFADGVDNQ